MVIELGQERSTTSTTINNTDDVRDNKTQIRSVPNALLGHKIDRRPSKMLPGAA
jgi:hypothetical protein